MRDKEVRQDYRYMPEPNLPPLVLDDSSISHQGPQRMKGVIDVNELRKLLPKLPGAIRAEWMKERGLSLEDCVILSVSETF